MADLLTLAEVYRRLDGACRAAGSQAAFAATAGVSAQFVSAVLHGQKSPSPALLVALGLRQVVRFAVVKSGNATVLGDLQAGAADAG